MLIARCSEVTSGFLLIVEIQALLISKTCVLNIFVFDLALTSLIRSISSYLLGKYVSGVEETGS